MNIARKITLVLTGISFVICCLFFNLLGGFAFISQNYEKCGIALIISTVFFLGAFIFGILKKVLPIIILNILGTACYIYTLAILSAIPNNVIPKENVEKIMQNHYFTISITVLLAMLAFFNYMHEDNIRKRKNKKDIKNQLKNRELSSHERIV